MLTPYTLKKRNFKAKVCALFEIGGHLFQQVTANIYVQKIVPFSLSERSADKLIIRLTTGLSRPFSLCGIGTCFF